MPSKVVEMNLFHFQVFWSTVGISFDHATVIAPINCLTSVVAELYAIRYIKAFIFVIHAATSNTCACHEKPEARVSIKKTTFFRVENRWNKKSVPKQFPASTR